MARIVYCPFFKNDLYDKKGETRVSCEHGALTFYDAETLKEYIDKYCGCMEGWKNCTLASSLLQYYEREE